MKTTERFRPAHSDLWQRAVNLATNQMPVDALPDRFRARVENVYREQGGAWLPNDEGWTWDAKPKRH